MMFRERKTNPSFSKPWKAFWSLFQSATFTALLFLTALPTQAKADGFFSDRERPFPKLWADPRDPKTALAYVYDGNGDSLMDLRLGGDLGFWEIDHAPDSRTAVHIRAMMTARFLGGSSSFNLQNTDYYGGAAISHKNEKHHLDLWIYHQSSHLGPDATTPFSPLNYSFEAARLLYLYEFGHFSPYAGATFRFRGDPAAIRHTFVFHLGGQFDWSDWLLAADLQWRGEHNWDINASLHIGYYLGKASIKRRQHLFLEIFNGHSNMGQFYYRPIFAIFAGIAGDF